MFAVINFIRNTFGSKTSPVAPAFTNERTSNGDARWQVRSVSGYAEVGGRYVEMAAGMEAEPFVRYGVHGYYSRRDAAVAARKSSESGSNYAIIDAEYGIIVTVFRSRAIVSNMLMTDPCYTDGYGN